MSEFQLCKCGCGKPAPIAKVTRKSKGYQKGQPMRYLPLHRHCGFTTRKDGRTKLCCRNGLEKYWARVVMENILFNKTGIYRELAHHEVVHHKDRDITNDILYNLELKTSYDHTVFHNKTKQHLNPIILVKDCAIMEFDNARQASKALGLYPSTVLNAIKRGCRAKGWKPYYLDK